MAEEKDNKIKTLSIDDREYEIEKMSDRSKSIVNLVVMTDGKIGNLQAEISIMNSARGSLIEQLKKSLEEDVAE